MYPQIISQDSNEYDFSDFDTILNVAADATNARMVQLFIGIGDGTTDKQATSGFWELLITIGSNVFDGEAMLKYLGNGVRATFQTQVFLIPANNTFNVQLKSHDPNDADVWAQCIMYDMTASDTRTVSGEAVTKFELQTVKSIDDNVINADAIGDDAFEASKFATGALNGKGDWNIGKTGYSLLTSEHTAIAVETEAALINEGDGQQLIDAIITVINSSLDVPALELTAIANAVWTNTTRTITGSTTNINANVEEISPVAGVSIAGHVWTSVLTRTITGSTSTLDVNVISIAPDTIEEASFDADAISSRVFMVDAASQVWRAPTGGFAADTFGVDFDLVYAGIGANTTLIGQNATAIEDNANQITQQNTMYLIPIKDILEADEEYTDNVARKKHKTTKVVLVEKNVTGSQPGTSVTLVEPV